MNAHHYKAAVRTRWYSGEVFNALTPVQFEQIEAWLKEKPVPLIRAIPDPSYQTQVLTDIAATLKDNARATVVMACGCLAPMPRRPVGIRHRRGQCCLPGLCPVPLQSQMHPFHYPQFLDPRHIHRRFSSLTDPSDTMLRGLLR